MTCRTRAEAEHALARAVKILEQLGVALNRAKTRIVHITRGFEFLGFKIQRGKGLMQRALSKLKASLFLGGIAPGNVEIGGAALLALSR